MYTFVPGTTQYDYYRLANLKGMLKLEKVGLKFSKGRALRPQLAKEFGLSPRAPHDDYIAEIQRRMEAMIK